MKKNMQNYKIEELLCENATMNHIPINAILELTPHCNMNCAMCYVRLSPKESSELGGIHSIEEWKSIAKQMHDAGTLFVLLTGGEPLLYPGFQELYLYLQQLGMIITINTNGTLIDEKWADFFEQHKPRRINITIYGKDSDAYKRLCNYADGYDKAVNAIQLLKERHVDVKVNGSATVFNENDCEKIIELAETLQVPWKIDTYMYPASRERKAHFDESTRLTPSEAAKLRTELMKRRNYDFKEMAKDFLEKAKNAISEIDENNTISCRAGRSSFAINWQGYMRPCILVTQPEIPVFSSDFRTAWEQIVKETAMIRLSSKCRTCAMRDVCQTCPACALLETGSYQGTPQYMCNYTNATIQYLEESIL